MKLDRMRAPSDNRDGGIQAPSTGPPVTVPTDGGTVVRSRLFIKYVTLFVAVVSVVLIANAVFDVYFSYQEQKASLIRIQCEQAEAAAGKIGQFISEIESQVGWTTQAGSGGSLPRSTLEPSAAAIQIAIDLKLGDTLGPVTGRVVVAAAAEASPLAGGR